jgi:hypothetical protein
VVLETEHSDDQAKAVGVSATREVTVSAGSKLSTNAEKRTGSPLPNSFPTRPSSLSLSPTRLPARISVTSPLVSLSHKSAPAIRLHCSFQRSYSSVSFPSLFLLCLLCFFRLYQKSVMSLTTYFFPLLIQLSTIPITISYTCVPSK